MSSKFKAGVFCWTDLGTAEFVAAKRFYQAIFGWKLNDLTMGESKEAFYSIARLKGKDVGALYPTSLGETKLPIPTTWLPYIGVKNVARSATKAKAAGAKLCMGPMDVMDKGRMAILKDPTGASFALWQARSHKGSEIHNTHGTVCWHDLNTPKTKKAGEFYTKVFGWKLEGVDFDGGIYHIFKLGTEGACGMWPQMMKGLPPTWLTYWQVDNCAKTVAKTKRLGGRALMGTTLVPSNGLRFAVLVDPQGVPFGILQPGK